MPEAPTQLTQAPPKQPVQVQMQAKSTDALDARIMARQQGLIEDVGVGIGTSLVLIGVILAIKELRSSFAVTKKPKTQAAAARR